MRKIILISFANTDFKKSLDRLEYSTRNFPFNERFFLTEKNLPKEFLKNLYYKRHRRGFGYWRWKSYLVNSYFRQLEENDILVYSDAGNYWNINGINRFNEYIKLCDSIESGILVFQENYPEKMYTKGDLLNYFNVYDNPQITDSNQFWGGAFIIRKTKISSEFISRWTNVHKNHYDLTTDKKSKKPNYPEFVENRHDQSTFSILAKLYPHVEISFEETTSKDNHWEKLDNYPIQARRLRFQEQSKIKKIIRKFIMSPYRFLLIQYLRVFENMYFANPKARF